MKISKILINGSFFCRNLTGIERFAHEVCQRLDSLAGKNEIAILVPANSDNSKIPQYKNIEIIQSNKKCTVFPIWEHIHFSSYARKIKAVPLDFANATPVFYTGIVFVHDIYAKLYPQDFSSLKDKLVRIYDCSMFWYAAKHAKKLITVSDFSRRQIAETYKIDPEKISVIYNGWEHFKNVQINDSVFNKFPLLKNSSYYFTLGSLSKRKNLQWIASYAQKHPESIFAVSGKAISGLIAPELKVLQSLHNVVLVGYVSDAEVKSLMQHCKAFIFPSYYEGFGIPPLEALSCGTPIVISNTACLPELYGNAAHYINPENTDVDLDKLLAQPVAEPAPLLQKYSYTAAAQELYKIVKSFLTK